MATYNKYFGLQKRYLAALIVVLLLIVMTVLELTNTTHLFHKQKVIIGNTLTTSVSDKKSTPNTQTSNIPKTSDTKTSSRGTQSATGTITISRVGQSTGSNTVSLRTVVNGISNGNCLVVFSKVGQPSVQQTFEVIRIDNYFSCGVADIPVNKFSVSGEWNINVRVIDSQSNDISNIATENSVQVQK